MSDTGIVKKPRNNSSKYNEQEIELGLRHTAMTSGNCRRASEELAAAGVHIPHQTLYDWSTAQHVERYTEIRKEVLPGVKAWAESKHMGVVDTALDGVAEMVARARAEVKDIPIRDIPGAARNLATVAGISTESAAKLRGEATSIIEHRTTPDELERKLERAGVTFVEAEEVDVGSEGVPAAVVGSTSS